jgi:enterochelin esterase-like enzyme
VVKAAAKLRQLGVRTVLLAGASQGAKASLMAAPAISPPVAGVVSLSAERTAQGPGREAVRRQADGGVRSLV